MKSTGFIWKGIRHYRSAYWGVLAGAAVGAMVLLGALMAGDSVQESLTKSAELRIGKVAKIFSGGERFFRDDLAGRNGGSAMIYLKGQVNVEERAEGQVQVIGVSEDFWDFAPQETSVDLSNFEAAISGPLARALDLEEGDSAVVRLQKPGLLSRDAPLSGESESVSSMRITVAKILSDEEFGRFSLEQTQVPPSSVFVPLKRLQKVLDLKGKANALLLDENESFDSGKLGLADYGISVVEVPDGVEVRSDRVFMEPRIEEKIEEKIDGEPVLTYLINTLATEVVETPYSMVTAVSGKSAMFLPMQPGEGEVVINDWLAKDLRVQVDDELTMDYFVVESGSKLVEKRGVFTVKAIVKMEGPAADKRWMPDFPGVADVESARDWEPGLPLDLTRIRDKDDEYWEEFKGTPKAFVSHQTGEELWANRWGKVTGMRVPGGQVDEVTKSVREILEPSLAGMEVMDFSEQAKEAAKSPVDFAILFLAMSFFLIIAAIALVTMLFRFNVEQRAEEGALLTAVGIPVKKISNWRMGEAFFVVLAGAIVGTLLAVIFCTIVLKVISSIWGDGTAFDLHLSGWTIAKGLLWIVELTLISVWLTNRKQVRQSASLRLNSGAEEEVGKSSKWATGFLVFGLLVVAGGIVMSYSAAAQGAFFLVGFGVLVSGLAVFRKRLSRIGFLGEFSSVGMAKVNLARRASRSLTVVGVLAAGVFLVLSVASFRKNGGENWEDKTSGAGGFAWWVETTSSVNRPADAKGEVDWFGLKTLVPFRIGEGDDVDCFNLTASNQPRLLGVDPVLLEGRFKTSDQWSILEGDGVPAIVDETTMMWVLKKKIGDELIYQDEWGNDFPVTIAGVVKDSIFQGSLILSEKKLLEKYPSLGGYQLFLSPDGKAREILQEETADLGGKVTATKDRIAAFHEVENTYIAIFNVLGGLGIILGSVGVGIVTARNLVERKAEFETLRMLGISKIRRSKIVKHEVKSMVAWGLGIGLVSALIAVIPVLGGTVGMMDLLWMTGLVLAMGFIANFVGTRAPRRL
ncbi:ABC transporter permease [bacterium]|nr:ABC transporter permease [bacterium]MDA7626316.1 ABC transporter permease [Akkermansiaceae bacterium]MDA7869864.1 ABC transporter permease [Akkermansiaceae bacterium]MDA7911486.1 ABC transporter permease [Akkermansiaceae bacterium]MDB4487419.1 ABC transporter permease [Akkermansiaceae bacterium]